MTVDMIVNATAYRVANDRGLRQSLRESAARAGARVHETYTLADLDQVALDLSSRGTDGVVLVGGDGSHMAGVSALARAFGALPPTGLAPGGTVCTIARNFGVRGPAGAYSRRLVEAAASGHARIEHTATLRVRDDQGREHVGFIFGAGLVARFFDVYDRSARRGRLTAAGIAARVFAGSLIGSSFARRILDPTPCAIAIDGATHASREWSLVLASVLRDVGLHLRAAYRAGEVAGRFHVVASGMAPSALGRQLPRVLAGRPLRGEPRVDDLARSVRLRFAAGLGSYVLDGDVFRAHEIDVEPGPDLPLLLPAVGPIASRRGVPQP